MSDVVHIPRQPNHKAGIGAHETYPTLGVRKLRCFFLNDL